MGNGNFGVSELRNPWTDRLKIWHTWLFGELTSYAKFRKIRQHKGYFLFFLQISCAPVQKKYDEMAKNGEDRRTQSRVIVATDPQTNTQTHTNRQTDYNTLRR